MATVKKAGEEPDRFEDVDFLKRFYKRYNKCYVLVGSMYYLYRKSATCGLDVMGTGGY